MNLLREMRQFLSSWSASDLTRFVENFGFAPPGANGEVDNYVWKLVPEFSLDSVLAFRGGKSGWIRWFDAENAQAQEEGFGEWTEDIWSYPDLSRNPIIVTLENSNGLVWDGNHRIGAALKSGITSLPAVVGVLRG